MNGGPTLKDTETLLSKFKNPKEINQSLEMISEATSKIFKWVKF
jgi:hypothetical protein